VKTRCGSGAPRPGPHHHHDRGGQERHVEHAGDRREDRAAQPRPPQGRRGPTPARRPPAGSPTRPGPRRSRRCRRAPVLVLVPPRGPRGRHPVDQPLSRAAPSAGRTTKVPRPSAHRSLVAVRLERERMEVERSLGELRGLPLVRGSASADRSSMAPPQGTSSSVRNRIDFRPVCVARPALVFRPHPHPYPYAHPCCRPAATRGPWCAAAGGGGGAAEPTAGTYSAFIRRAGRKGPPPYRAAESSAYRAQPADLDLLHRVHLLSFLVHPWVRGSAVADRAPAGPSQQFCSPSWRPRSAFATNTTEQARTGARRRPNDRRQVPTAPTRPPTGPATGAGRVRAGRRAMVRSPHAREAHSSCAKKGR